MRKKQTYNPLQLSLFGDDNVSENEQDKKHLEREWATLIEKTFTENNLKKTENENDLSQNADRERTDGIDASERRRKTESGTEPQRTDDIRPDERTAARTLFGNENGENIDTVSSEDYGRMVSADVGTIQQRDTAGRSRRNSLEESGGSSRTVTSSNEKKESVSNFHSTIAPYSEATFCKSRKYQDNIAALDLLIQLNAEHRVARPEEQITLAKYVGWGGLKEILLNPHNDAEWKTESDNAVRKYVRDVYDKIETLDPDGSQGLLFAAKRSILNAHYTSYEIINAIYDAVNKAGFKSGHILEPAAGVGNFLAAMPIEMANDSEVTAIEMDRLTGKILQRLFPTAETYINGFEKLNLPVENYDLIISNVPFGDIPIYDTQLVNLKDKRYSDAATNIHNYFFAKSILLAKPDGMIAFITSRYTLDSQKEVHLRNLIKDTCAFCGAVRLPNTAFKANAGTEVVSDIIFLRKFRLGEDKQQQHNFLNVKSIPFTDQKGDNGIMSYNEYFHHHPKHMIGTIEFGGLYNKDEFNLKGNKEENITERIAGIIENIFEQPVIQNTINNQTEKLIADTEEHIRLNRVNTIGNMVELQNGSIGVISDRFYVDEILDNKVIQLGINPYKIRYNRQELSGEEELLLSDAGIDIEDFFFHVVEPLRIKREDIQKARHIVALREMTKDLIFKEAGGYNDFLLDNLRTKLKEKYDQFVFRYGNITDKRNEKILKYEADIFVIQSLEVKNSITGEVKPADILFKRTINPAKEILQTDNISDAVSLSLEKYGKLQMNYICELMDKTYEDVMQSQVGDDTLIFKDETGDFLTRDEYLSGNVVKKLELARDAALSDSYYLNNVSQLEKVQPQPISAVDIYCPLHTRWIPQDYIREFLYTLLKTDEIDLYYSPSADAYNLSINDRTGNVEAFTTKREKAEWVINHALNGVEPKVTYTVEENNVKKQVFDPEDTQLAKDIYRKVKDAWDDWKYEDFNRREDLESIYNRTFNTTVLRKYSGAHLTLPGMVGYKARPHQKDCVFRNVQQLGGINDHMVGAGKTLIQIATAMELRRLSIANKPIIIGLKSQIPQLYEQFKIAYPLAKVLFPRDKDFEKANRNRLLNTIATNDWDCIILSHDQFSKIRQPVDIQIALTEELTEVMKAEIDFVDDKQQKKQLEKRLYKYEQKIEALKNTPKDSGVLEFSELGIDFLMVDESQEFKNLEFTTTKKNIRGLGNPMGSKKAFNMLIACRYLQQLHGGDKGIIFSSGTPISNSMAELYLLFKYLCPSKMQELGLSSFDRWAAIFANDYSDLEYYMGRFKEVQRFREFVNLPELLTMYRELADVRNNTNLTLDKPKANHVLIKIQPSEIQLNLIEKLQKFIDSKGITYAEKLGLTAGFDEDRGINPSFALLAVNFAKKLSIDPRLIDPSYPAGTKLSTAADIIYKKYTDTGEFKGTQLVFSDIGTPKSINAVDNLYDYLLGDTPQSDMDEIFGENYYEQQKQPKIDDIKDRVADILGLKYDEVNNLIIEANTKEKFNVYDEMKRLLSERGIPADEIVFIHDYNTREKKEKLFEAVNNGTIRIVIGSTKKLGVGVNVQQRGVSQTQLDIPWKPSDLEQRIGRTERQGNWAAKEYCNNEVDVFYCATERTLDASMYNTVSQKAKFISQLKVEGIADVRSIKDIEEDIDLGSMAAELSGDPIFKEKADLTKRITELEQMQKAFNSKKYNTESRLANAVRLVEHYDKKIDIFRKCLPTIKEIPKNSEGKEIFGAKFNGRLYDKISDYGVAIIAEAELAKKYKQTGSIISLGELWGFKVIGKVEYNFMDKCTEIKRTILSPFDEIITDEKVLPDGEIANGTQVRQAILEIPSELERMVNNKSKQESNIEEYKHQLDERFPYSDELHLKKERLVVVDSLIIAKAKENEQEKDNEVAMEEQVQLKR